MNNSILLSTKKILGIAEDYTAFDLDIITHVNSALSTLHQLGVGPADGFMINGEDERWEDLLGTDPAFNLVKSLVYLKVRMIFDPPQTGYLVEALKEEVRQLEWRINARREWLAWPITVPPA